MQLVAFIHEHKEQFHVVLCDSSNKHYLHYYGFDSVERACKMRDRILANGGVSDLTYWLAQVNPQTPASVTGTARINHF